MAPVKVGDYVKVSDRDVNLADIKSGLFYNHFRNLTGTIERVYDDNTVCVDVDIDVLPEDIRARHIEIQDGARDKWIFGLSQEAQNRLTEQDKQFKMSYKVLVATSDVAPEKKGAKPKPAVSKKADTAVKAEEKPAPNKTEEAPKRLTEKDLEAAEEAALKAAQKDEK